MHRCGGRGSTYLEQQKPPDLLKSPSQILTSALKAHRARFFGDRRRRRLLQLARAASSATIDDLIAWAQAEVEFLDGSRQVRRDPDRTGGDEEALLRVNTRCEEASCRATAAVAAPCWSAMPGRSLRWPLREEVAQDCRIFLPGSPRSTGLGVHDTGDQAQLSADSRPVRPRHRRRGESVRPRRGVACGLPRQTPRRCRGPEPTEPDRVDRRPASGQARQSARISPRGTPGGPTGRWHRVHVHGFRSCRRRCAGASSQ